MPTVTTRAIDLVPLRTAIRTLLLANGTITGIVGTAVYRDLDNTDNAAIYVVVSIPSSAPAETYGSAYINALVDVQCVCLNYPGDADTVAAAIQTAMLDTTWTVTGYDVVNVSRVMDISRSQMTEEKVFYFSGGRFRVILRHQ